MSLPVDMQSSHRNGGRVFLIFVADPRTRRLSQSFGSSGWRSERRRQNFVSSTIAPPGPRTIRMLTLRPMLRRPAVQLPQMHASWKPEGADSLSSPGRLLLVVISAEPARSPASFRAEADMLSVIAANSAVFGRRAIPIFEVPCTAGVPDVVLLRFNSAALQDRTNRSFLSELADVKTMLAVTSMPTDRNLNLAEISRRVGISPRHLRSVILPRLAEGGHMARDRDEWHPTHRYRSLASNVVTVEAKLRDWRRGVMQASRHRLASDSAWLAVDSARSVRPAEAQQWFAMYGIGLAVVSVDGSVEAAILPGTRRRRNSDRELLVERAASIYHSGRRSGAISRVFGRFLSVSTGVDPRLEGVAGC
jgi:hypothetical protein